MRSGCLFVAALLVAVVPGVASAAVTINIESVVPGYTGTDQTVFVEVFATDLDGSDERLNAYTIAIDGVGFTPNGVHFAVPNGSSFGVPGRPVNHPYVFKDLETIPPLENFGSTYNRLQVGATTVAQDDEVDIINGSQNGLLRFGVVVPANTPAGPFLMVVDARALSLAGLGAPIVATPGQPGAWAYVPEPSSSALLLLPLAALLRRRRGPQTVFR